MDEFINLNNFTKQAKIGEGSFGKVFKVIEKSTENIFAAKISYLKLNESNQKFIKNLRRELTILLRLNHPSVLKFIGYSPVDFHHKPYPVIITEYSSNGTLDDIINHEYRSFSPEMWTDTKKLINIYGIASAMSYLHLHEIVHRDLKPANILEDDNFYPKIGDFGLSKIYHQNIDSMTSQSTAGFKGTPIYTAPEIWCGSEYTKAGDVYAFSMITYEIFSLEKPFKNCKSVNDLYSKIVVNEERPEFDFPIPDCYKELITKCWSTNPEDRPTFQEIVNELRTNKEFITSAIDENEFFDFVDLLDTTECSFEPNKKFKTIISKEVTDKKFEEEENDRRSITIKKFCNFSLKRQQLEISNIISSNENRSNIKDLQNINKLLIFLLKINADEDERYFSASDEDENSLIEDICTQRIKITLSYNALEIIVDNLLISSSEFSNYIGEFEILNIDLKYPTTSFERIYEQVINLKQKYEEQIHINISIDDITETDMRFRNDEYINSIIFGYSVKKISGNQVGFRGTGGGSFYECSSLTNVLFPSTITEIGDYAFCACSSLTNFIFPDFVTSLGEGSFFGCSSLKEITIHSPVTSIKKYVFAECSSLTKITIPSSAISIGDSAFSECTSLTQITIPSSITSIGNYAFSECSSLTQITIPSSVTSIGNYAFYRCSLITRIIISSSVNEIGDFAFSECSSSMFISILSSKAKIGKKIFNKCKIITLSNDMQRILPYTFYKCSSLEQINDEHSEKV